MAMTLTPIVGINQRVQEIGRIRMGDKDGRGLPIKLRTFRLTTYDPAILAVCQQRYGGEVKPWEDAPDPGMFELVTESAALDILIPRSLENRVTQAWELWKGGTCERRCDGVVEQNTDGPCICGPDRGSSDAVCDIMTRVSVVLDGVPGLGTWRLDTGGYNAATTLPATIQFLLSITDPRIALVEATLHAVERSRKVRDGGKVQTHRFIVPVLGARGLAISSIAGPAEHEALPETVEPRRPLTAQERVAAERARVEASHAAGTMPAPAEEPTAGGTTEADHAPDPARTHAVASGAPDEASTADAGAEGEAATSAPPTSPEPAQCGSMSPYDPPSQCGKEQGHKGNHANRDRESWS